MIPAEGNGRSTLSPSVRKVWIEMISSSDTWKNSFVTFRKEGVDWNYRIGERRGANQVTFRKEGVDWNKIMSRSKYDSLSHLPQGRCGLKCWDGIWCAKDLGHLPQGRCGLKFLRAWNKNEWQRHLPQGRCGLKFKKAYINKSRAERHLPQGRCGLKLSMHHMQQIGKVWIEI